MNEPEIGRLLRDGAFRWDDPAHIAALRRWEGTRLIDPDDPRFRPTVTAVVAYTRNDRLPTGDRRTLSRWAREIDRACRLGAREAS